MIIERQLENQLIDYLKNRTDLTDVYIVGSRDIAAVGKTKSEAEDKTTIIAVACGFRQNDAFSLSLISMPLSITIMSRTELDPTSQKHDIVVEIIADLLSYWHKYGNVMSEVFVSDKFLPGELRMDGGSNRTFDNTTSTWHETINFSIRGAEKFNE